MKEFYDFGEWYKQGFEMWKKLRADEGVSFKAEIDGKPYTIRFDLNVLSEEQKERLFRQEMQDGRA